MRQEADSREIPKRNERFVIFKDEDGLEMVTEEEERVLRWG